jgi:oligopeptide/dipeptide ABC transporter ATP-binding protein
MALTCNPELLIADEPTTALDVTIQAQILSLIDKLKDDFGASILLITHDLGVIAEMAQTVAVMYTGKIVEYSNVVDLFREPKHPYTLGLMKSIPKIDRPRPTNKKLPTIQGVVPSLYELPVGCSFNNRCPVSLKMCQKKSPSLLESNSDHLVRCWRYA